MTREVNGFLLSGIALLLAALLFTGAWWTNLIGYFIAPTSLSQTQGIIVESAVGYHAGRSAHYYPHIIYRYSVSGKIYRSKQVTFGAWGFSKRNPAERYTDRYPVGLAVTVFYHPRFPSFAVLEPRSKAGTGAMLILTTALCLISVAMILRGRYNSSRAAGKMLQS